MVGNPFSFIEGIWRFFAHYLTKSHRQPALYDQIILFGDSITEFAECQKLGFGFAPALRDGEFSDAVHFLFRGILWLLSPRPLSQFSLVSYFLLSPPPLAPQQPPFGNHIPLRTRTEN
jgi:hypothetical protein